ncbi:homoserine dehydrogenase [Paucisalibacillus sp. EB02]|uniref:homoserine dehydrogenase n=1 Tax=Paucisalibacillus sp. EB02 TaxID=1347087 RepID=UPI0004B1094E|nr:homoserine dehydrogenase [Paucisalibacillus sp. EB02]
MKKIKVALLGFGTVGKGIYHSLKNHPRRISNIGFEIEIVSIVVKHSEKHQDFEDRKLITTNFQTVIQNSEIDVVLEAIVGKEPAFTYLSQSIKAGKQIITANKEMFAHHSRELLELAKEHHVEIGFEATTAGGIPVINTIEKLFQFNEIKKITAILNGTSNYILTQMRVLKLPFNIALEQAQELGYAEADPTNDIEGFDSFYKLMILSQLIYGKQPDWSSVNREGIVNITEKDIEEYERYGRRIKHVASLELQDGNITASVEPIVLSSEHPLYSIEGVENAVVIEGDVVGRITLSGPGAGAFPTASAMLEDLSLILQSNQVTKLAPILAN